MTERRNHRSAGRARSRAIRRQSFPCNRARCARRGATGRGAPFPFLPRCLARAALLTLVLLTLPRLAALEIVADASVDFTWESRSRRIGLDSNAVRVVTGAPLRFDLLDERALSLPAGSLAELPHRLVNRTDEPISIRLTVAGSDGDSFRFGRTELVLDADGDGTFDAGEATLAPAERFTLGPRESLDVLICGLVPIDTRPGATARLMLLAEDVATRGLQLRFDTVVSGERPDTAGLLLEKRASRHEARVGDTVEYTLRVRNVTGATLPSVEMQDRPPRGFSYVPGSLLHDESPLPDPVLTGGVLRVPLGHLPAEETVRLQYRLRVGPDALDGDGVNRAHAAGGGYTSNEASARIEVLAGVFTREGVLVGKVFADASGDGRQQPGEAGVPGVRVYLEDGTYAVTDADGKYSLYGLSPRTHLLKLDPLTVPAGATVSAGSTRHAGVGTSQFVDFHHHELQHGDFALVAEGSLDAEIARRRSHLSPGPLEAERMLKARLDPDRRSRAIADPRAGPAAGLLDAEAGLRRPGPAAPPPLGQPEAPASPASDDSFDLSLLDPAPGFLNLVDGQVLPIAQSDVSVKAPAGSQLALAVNGTLLERDQVGRISRLEARGVEVWSFVGVNLNTGRNRLRLVITDPFGNPREGAAISVVAPGPLARVEVTLPARAVADGLTAATLGVELLDARGVPVTTRTALTLTASAGRWLAHDLDPAQPGTQVFVEGGRAKFALAPPLEPGDCSVTFSSGAVSGGRDFAFTPDLRPLLATGLVEGTLHFGDTGGLPHPRGARDSFQRELLRWSTAGHDGRFVAGARAAFFLKGRVRDQFLVTAAYDSEKDRDERLFRDLRPGEFYPVYGDASVRGFDAQSTSPLYVRVDHGRSYLVAGDFTTRGDAGTGRDSGGGLAAYRRSLTGVKEHYESETMQVDLWASRDASEQIVEEIPANGTSGPYQLSARDARINSERVEIITRDRDQPSRVIRVRTLSRFFDYEFEPFTGRLLLKAPAASLDASLNPMSIRLTREVADGGPAFWTYGTDATWAPRPWLRLGATVARDENPAGGHELAGANLAFRLAERTSLVVEAARSEAGTAGVGRAGRIEFRHEGARTDVHGYLGRTDPAFHNPGSLLLPGRIEGGLKFSHRLTPTTSLVAQAVLTEDIARAARREGVRLDVARAFGRWRVELGGRHSDQSHDSPGRDADRRGRATVTSVRAKVTAPLPLLANATGFAEYERAVDGGNEELAALGFDADLRRGGRAYARHEFVTSLGGPFELNEAERRHHTVAGIETDYMRNGSVFSEYRAGSEIYRQDAEAAVGLRHLFSLGDGLRVNATFERVTPLAGDDRHETTAATAALEVRRDDWRANARLETRLAPTSGSVLNSLGYARRLGADWTVLAKAVALLTETTGAAAGRSFQGRAQAGLAWRPAHDDRWSLLAKYELQVESDDRPRARTSRRLAHVVSADFLYRSAASWSLSGHYAGKLVDETAAGAASAHLVGVRWRREFAGRWDAGLGAWLRVAGDGRQRRYAIGPEFGVTLRRNLRLGLGCNIAGFRDRDLAPDGATAAGVFLRLAFKFDENLLGAGRKVTP